MKNLLGGLDIGSEAHHVIIMNDKEKILYDRKISHKFSGFYEAIEEIREIEGREERLWRALRQASDRKGLHII